MADKPVTEIVNLDAVLDALPDSPTTSDVFEATLPFSARDVAASATQRAINGGGGGGGTATAKHVVVPIAFTDIDTDTGFANLYLLLEGETVVAAWPIITETFDGTAGVGLFPFTAQFYGPGGAAAAAQLSDSFDCTASSVANAVDGLMGGDPTDGGGATSTVGMFPLVSPVIGGGPVQLVIDFATGQTPVAQGTQGQLEAHLLIAVAP